MKKFDISKEFDKQNNTLKEIENLIKNANDYYSINNLTKFFFTLKIAQSKYIGIIENSLSDIDKNIYIDKYIILQKRTDDLVKNKKICEVVTDDEYQKNCILKVISFNEKLKSIRPDFSYYEEDNNINNNFQNN